MVSEEILSCFFLFCFLLFPFYFSSRGARAFCVLDRNSQKRRPAAGGHRPLRLETIDFVTPKVTSSKKKQIPFSSPVLLSGRSFSRLRMGLGRKLALPPVEVFREFGRKMASFGQNIRSRPKLAIFLSNSRNTLTGGSANFRLNPILKRENDRPLSKTGAKNGICF